MEIETRGKLRLELIPLELEGLGRWASYLSAWKFDDQAQDFLRVLEKTRVEPERVYSSEEEAIEAARRIANDLVANGKLTEF